MGNDYLMVTDLGTDGLAEVLRLAADAKTNPRRYVGRLAGGKVVQPFRTQHTGLPKVPRRAPK